MQRPVEYAISMAMSGFDTDIARRTLSESPVQRRLNFSDNHRRDRRCVVPCSPKQYGIQRRGYYFRASIAKKPELSVGIIFSGIGASAAQAYVPRTVLSADTLDALTRTLPARPAFRSI